MPFDATPLEYPTDPVLDTLVKVRALLTSKTCWAKNCSAKDKNGRSTDANGNNAIAWCLGGAIIKTAGLSLFFNKELDPYCKALGFAHEGHLITWNDNYTTTHPNVLARLDKAIERRRADLLQKAEAL